RGGRKMNTLEFKEGQTYICTKACNESWWTEGKEYNVVCNTYGIPVLVNDGGYKWTAKDLSAFRNEFKLKENTKMNTSEIKEGQTYVCKRDNMPNWTLGKEYKVVKVVFENGLGLAIV